MLATPRVRPLRTSAPDRRRLLCLLCRSGWYYHKEAKAWLTRAPNTEPVQKADRCVAGGASGAPQGAAAAGRGRSGPSPSRVSPVARRLCMWRARLLAGSLCRVPHCAAPSASRAHPLCSFERGSFFLFDPNSWEVISPVGGHAAAGVGFVSGLAAGASQPASFTHPSFCACIDVQVVRKDNFVVHFEQLERAPGLSQRAAAGTPAGGLPLQGAAPPPGVPPSPGAPLLQAAPGK